MQVGNTKANVIKLDAPGKPAVGKGIQIVLADVGQANGVSQNPESVKAARGAGMGDLVGKLRSMGGTDALAYAEVNGTRILVSVDRILEKIEAAHLDVNSAADQAKIEKVVEGIITHEVGHSLGLDDNDKLKGLTMNKAAPSFSDDIFLGLMKSEFDKVQSSLADRAQSKPGNGPPQ
jgi:hypothetical protein